MVESVEVAGAPRVDQDTKETLRRYKEAINELIARVKSLEAKLAGGK